MSDSFDGSNAGQTSIQARSAELHNFADHSMSREQARAAVLTDLETLSALASPAGLNGHHRPTALATMGRIAESQRSYDEALAETDPQIHSQALATAKRQRDDIVRAQTDYRQTPEGMAAAPQANMMREAVRVAEIEHDGLRAGRSYGDLVPVAANRVTATDALVPKGNDARLGGPPAISAKSLGPDDATPAARKQSLKDTGAPEHSATALNSMRSAGDTTEKRRTVPPLEDRFNVMRTGLIEKEYHFRDQAGRVAFTDKFMSISTGSESPAAIKAMVDRAAERGWATVRLNGSPEFARQAWIAASAQGLKAVGHTPTDGDREAAVKERTRLQGGQDAAAHQRPGEGMPRFQSPSVDRVNDDRSAVTIGGERQLAAAIEKALVDGKVSPELRGQVRAMMADEGARRAAGGERFKVPLYDARAPRARAQTIQTGPQRRGDRERSR